MLPRGLLETPHSYKRSIVNKTLGWIKVSSVHVVLTNVGGPLKPARFEGSKIFHPRVKSCENVYHENNSSSETRK